MDLVSSLPPSYFYDPYLSVCQGLTVVTAHLLLHSPEEDAFWILVSLVDTHMRPYYTPNCAQLDADASLFGKAVETMDPQMSRKLFVDMGLRPIDMCRVWYVYGHRSLRFFSFDLKVPISLLWNSPHPTPSPSMGHLLLRGTHHTLSHRSRHTADLQA